MILRIGHSFVLSKRQVRGVKTSVSQAATVRVHTKKYLCALKCAGRLSELGSKSVMEVMATRGAGGRRSGEVVAEKRAGTESDGKEATLYERVRQSRAYFHSSSAEFELPVLVIDASPPFPPPELFASALVGCVLYVGLLCADRSGLAARVLLVVCAHSAHSRCTPWPVALPSPRPGDPAHQVVTSLGGAVLPVL